MVAWLVNVLHCIAIVNITSMHLRQMSDLTEYCRLQQIAPGASICPVRSDDLTALELSAELCQAVSAIPAVCLVLSVCNCRQMCHAPWLLQNTGYCDIFVNAHLSF